MRGSVTCQLVEKSSSLTESVQLKLYGSREGREGNEVEQEHWASVMHTSNGKPTPIIAGNGNHFVPSPPSRVLRSSTAEGGRDLFRVFTALFQLKGIANG